METIYVVVFLETVEDRVSNALVTGALQVLQVSKSYGTTFHQAKNTIIIIIDTHRCGAVFHTRNDLHISSFIIIILKYTSTCTSRTPNRYTGLE